MIPVATKVESKLENAFTRTDLAVSVAMASLLLVLVISSQAGPRSRVFEVTDASNNRRLMQAMISFAGDNGGLMPNPCWGTTDAGWLYGTNFPANSGNTLSSFEAAYPLQLASLTNGQLFPYVQDSRVFMCPADQTSNPLFWQRGTLISSYTWNGAVNGGDAHNTCKLSQFRPDSILQWETDDRTPFDINDGSQYPDEGVSLRHGTNYFMFGMFGGGVGTMSGLSWYQNGFAGVEGKGGSGIPTSMLPNRLWCYPGGANGVF